MIRRKIDFQKLLNNCIPYSDGVLFEIFRWMVKTGWNFQQPWARGRSKHGVFEWLYGLSCVGAQFYWYDHGFSFNHYRDQLRMAFVRAIVSDDALDVVKDWREKERIGIGRYRMLEFTQGINSMDLDRNIYSLFNFAGKRLAVQLNEYHPGAVEINKVLLTTNGDEWIANMKYGYEGSEWNHHLADQEERSFQDFISESLKAVPPTAEET